MIDNYDSFTYNLVQYLGELGAELEVVRNDAEPLAAMVARRPDGVVISPGPGRPEDAGVTVPAVRVRGGRHAAAQGCAWAPGSAGGGRVAA
jgi:anthranilate synthase component 2